MVFESLVADLLNRFIGDYVENLDRSQLKIGIWGGDIVLRNLILKESALDELNLPLKTVYGQLGKLSLKIPWKNIYSAPVEATVENLYLLVNPSQSVVYNEEKEEKLKWAAKQALLEKVDQAKKLEKEKKEANAGKKVDDTFTEKLATQIVRNVQISIKDIHVRYEDGITRRDRGCFSVGITLHQLVVHSVNEGNSAGQESNSKDPVFFKLMMMEGLSIYWNSTVTCAMTSSVEEGSSRTLNDEFLAGISSKNYLPPMYEYILGPINAEANLQMNPRPELLDFTIPKLSLTLNMDKLQIGVNKCQYQELMQLLESFDRMSKAAPYRKYRPNIGTSYAGNYKLWWKFAVTCILEETVRRKFNNWNWAHMRKHRNACREYAALYKLKLTASKIGNDALSKLTELETFLDTLNILLIRQRIETEVENEGKLVKSNAGKGWFQSWFGGGVTATETPDENSNIIKKFEAAMTDEEKEKLYRAIDYHENSISLDDYPVPFVAVALNFTLGNLTFTLYDAKWSEESILQLDFSGVEASMHQRPAARAISVTGKMESLIGLGIKREMGEIPRLVKSKMLKTADDGERESFVFFAFETNPLDGACDQRFILNVKPLKVVYDALTINKVSSAFATETDISHLKQQLQEAASSKLVKIKEKSALSLQHAIQKSPRLDVNVDFTAPYLILPRSGFYSKNESVIVANFGNVSVKSKVREYTDELSAKRMTEAGSDERQLMEIMMDRCYDSFSMRLANVQVLIAYAGENWKEGIIEDIGGSESEGKWKKSMHMLEPVTLCLNIDKCIVTDDARLPIFKFEASLPDITVKIVEKRLLDAVALILSIPFPESSTNSLNLEEGELNFQAQNNSKDKMYAADVSSYGENEFDEESVTATTTAQYLTNVQGKFKLNVLTIYVESEKCDDGNGGTLLEATVSSLQMEARQSVFATNVSFSLGGISVIQKYGNDSIPAISTPISHSKSDDPDDALFTISLTLVDRRCPPYEWTTVYDSTAASLKLHFSRLYVLAHQEAIMEVLIWTDHLRRQLDEILKPKEESASFPATLPPVTTAAKGDSKYGKKGRKRKSSISSNVSLSSSISSYASKIKEKFSANQVVAFLSSIAEMNENNEGALPDAELSEMKKNFLVVANLGQIQMSMVNTLQSLATLRIEGLEATVVMKDAEMQVDAVLRHVSVYDPCPETMYSKILYISEKEEALRVKFTSYNKKPEEKGKGMNEGEADFDASLHVRLSRIRCVFINDFVANVLAFAEKFQYAKEAVTEASAAAVATAKMNARQAYESTAKISLDVVARAPDIVIPVNKRDLRVARLFLGDLILTNELIQCQDVDFQGAVVYVDRVNVELNSISVIRGKYSDEDDWALRSLENSGTLLKRTSIVVQIERNLSAEWYHKLPKVDLLATMGDLQLALCEVDYRIVLEILEENISAPSKSVENRGGNVRRARDASESDGDSDSCDESAQHLIVNAVVEKNPSFGSEIDANKVDFKFVVRMERLTCDLFFGDSQTAGLANLTLFHLSAEGSTLANGSMNLVAALTDCQIRDTHTRGGVTDIYMRSKSGGDEAMIDFSFSSEGTQSSVSICVRSFVLILNTEHLLQLQRFFAKPVVAVGAIQKGKTEKVAVKPVVEKPKAQAICDASHTKFSLIVQKPDVILVENLKHLDAKALILNTEIKLGGTASSDGRMSLNAVVDDVKMFCCCYNPALREKTSTLVLYPMRVEAVGCSNDQLNLHLDVTFSDVKLSVTPAIIELSCRISKSLSPESGAEPTATVVVDYSDIWRAKQISVDDCWFLSEIEVGEEALDILDDMAEVVEEASDMGKTDRKDVVVVKIDKLVVSLEDGRGSKTIPMLLADMGVKAIVNKFPDGKVKVEGDVKLCMNYYNGTLASWEPVIEPIYQLNAFVPWQLHFSMTSRGQCDAALLPLMELNVSSDHRLELTVTKCCVETLKNLSESFAYAATEENIRDVVDYSDKSDGRELSGMLSGRKVSEKRFSDKKLMTSYHFATFPYLFRNAFGTDARLCLDPSQDFARLDNSDGGDWVMVKDGESIALKLKEDGDQKNARKRGDDDNDEKSLWDRKCLKLMINGSDRLLKLPTERATKRYFSLPLAASSSTETSKSVLEPSKSTLERGRSPSEPSRSSWAMISHVELINGLTNVTITGQVTIENELNVEMYVWYRAKGSELSLAGIVGKTPLPLPIFATCGAFDLFFSAPKFNVTGVPFAWKSLDNTLTCDEQFLCYPTNAEDEDPFFFRVVGRVERVYDEACDKRTMRSAAYTIRLRPAVSFKNFLPVNVACSMQGAARNVLIKPGHTAHLSSVEPNFSSIRVTVQHYGGKRFAAKKLVERNADAFSVWSFQSEDEANEGTSGKNSNKNSFLNLGVLSQHVDGTLVLTLYCPFWMINKTGLSLSYKCADDTTGSNVVHHAPDFKEPVLFSFKERHFFDKKKGCVKVGGADGHGLWSGKFSLDVAGSSGSVICRISNSVYKLGIYIRMNYNSLTKQVIFSPFYTIINQCRFTVEAAEVLAVKNGENARDVANQNYYEISGEGGCVAFWPATVRMEDEKGLEKSMKLGVAKEETCRMTFPYERLGTYLLPLETGRGGIQADVQVTEGGTYISLSSYQPGMAAALILNHTEYALTFGQWDDEDVKKKHSTGHLNGMSQILYNWREYSANRDGQSKLSIHFGSADTDAVIVDVTRDGIGEIMVAVDDNANGEGVVVVPHYWATFLDGMQRVLLVTGDLFVAKRVQNATTELDVIRHQMTLSISGMGLSIVHNELRREICYLNISSSNVIWETQRKEGKRYKPVDSSLNFLLERAYLRYNQKREFLSSDSSNAGTSNEEVIVDENVTVNFDTGHVVKPELKRLRRTFSQGVWIRNELSDHFQQFHVKIHRLQIDDQSYEATFPVIFAPVPPPKSVAADKGFGKDFVELSVVERRNERSTIRQFSYFKILVQEFHVKADLRFLDDMAKFVESGVVSEEEEATWFDKDCQVVHEALLAHISTVTSQGQRHFYDLLHFSPLKIHVSFSLSGADLMTESGGGIPLLNLLTRSIGVTLTDINDIVFRLAYFEERHRFLSSKQIMAQVQNHYVGQLLKQLYVLVLGLDVLGNPFGLVTGIGQGVEDFFYEPFQGAIQGPSEFAEGVMLGMRSFFSHTVGGAAGAVGRITGAMGKGLAALTLDEEYQRKRRQRQQQQQGKFGDGGKGLLMGVVEGVGGVVSKPISGARQEGVGGFMKGVGKGMVGLFVRPAAGVVDFASGTVNAVKRVATCSEDVKRFRLPRCLGKNGLVVPYDSKSARGFKMLMELSKGKYLLTDNYVFHVVISDLESVQEILMLTDNRVMYLCNRRCIIDNFFCDALSVEWQYLWSELQANGVKIHEKGISIQPEGSEGGRRGLFGIAKKSGHDKGKVVIIPDECERQMVLRKIYSLMHKCDAD